MDAKNRREKRLDVFTDIINKIEADAVNFEELEFEKQLALVDDLLLALDFGFLEHDEPLFKLAIRRLNKLLEIYSSDIQQYSKLKKIILRALATKGYHEFKLFLNCYNLKGLKNIDEGVIISDLEVITCLLIKQGVIDDALLASKILIKYLNNFTEKNTAKKNEIINLFFKAETCILSMAARTNNKIVFIKNIENMLNLLKISQIVNYETRNSFKHFIINALLFVADKNWLGTLKIIESVLTKISWKDNVFVETSRKIIYEWIQIISMLIIRKWNHLQQEYLLGLIKFANRCNKENNKFSDLMISKVLMLQVSKDGLQMALASFKSWFVFLAIKFDLLMKKEFHGSKKEISCSSNKYVELLYNFFVFVEKANLKANWSEILKTWYDFWSDVKIKKTVYYRIDALTKLTINYWFILHDNQSSQMPYLEEVLGATDFEEKYKYLIYDRSKVIL